MIYKQSFTHTDHIEFPGSMLFATDEMNKIKSAEGSSKSGGNLLEQNGGIATGNTGVLCRRGSCRDCPGEVPHHVG